ncbi:MAG: protein translocase subunit SecF, partial [Lachnospiraceae bacterium]|nr:protein translocase subunit SecF [Lachnospiraceae bacterium]
YYGVQKAVKVFGFVKNRMKYFLISGVLFAICIAGLVVNKINTDQILNYGLDFVGGTSTQITFDSGVTIDQELKSSLEDVFRASTSTTEVNISDIEGENAILVSTAELSVEENDALTEALVSGNYGISEDNIQTETISATVSGEMKSDAVIAVIVSAICMLLYIWIRFKNLSFGAASVLALIHDVIVVLMVYAVFSKWISVGNTFIACMLTIVGYSINATIVIFDRIRENMQTKQGKDQLEGVVNLSISQTISRSINTSLTTAFMVIMLVILGVDSIRQFAIPLLAGIVCGCYSSICIAGTLYYVFKSRFWGKKVK